MREIKLDGNKPLIEQLTKGLSQKDKTMVKKKFCQLMTMAALLNFNKIPQKCEECINEPTR